MLFGRCSRVTCRHNSAASSILNAEGRTIARFLAQHFHCRVQCIAGEIARAFNELRRHQPLGSPAQFALRVLRSTRREVLEEIRRQEEEDRRETERLQIALSGVAEALEFEQDEPAEADQEGKSYTPAIGN